MEKNNEKTKKKTPQEKKNPISHAKWVEYKKERNAHQRAEKKTEESKITLHYTPEQGDYDDWIQKTQQEAERIIDKLNTNWREETKTQQQANKLLWTTIYHIELMEWEFFLKCECGSLVTKWKPDLTMVFINEWLQHHNC